MTRTPAPPTKYAKQRPWIGAFLARTAAITLPSGRME